MTTEQKHLAKPAQCPFAVYDYPCDKTECGTCTIRIEAQTKENEGIAGNMKDYKVR